jgi:hypothetical protein
MAYQFMSDLFSNVKKRLGASDIDWRKGGQDLNFKNHAFDAFKSENPEAFV